ncbi:hypothetical protein GCM10008014_30400 [Paenibacillus silvae]|uniref:Uncharacterized protein n=1 Tax=Paenibacillus silvae TaxID=1325358 RepID=A0ABQ1ZFC6_9BACL|nr:hypothetical protein [Paenibacillus silvae]GGH58109.1 hypothetical protein GCM10008014_30400 [Paenibacillus silvae]
MRQDYLNWLYSILAKMTEEKEVVIFGLGPRQKNLKKLLENAAIPFLGYCGEDVTSTDERYDNERLFDLGDLNRLIKSIIKILINPIIHHVAVNKLSKGWPNNHRIRWGRDGSSLGQNS